jgi:putative ABC transport system permease protein
MGVFRSLWRSPGFTVAAVFTLTVGIGANVAIFSVVRAVLLNPLCYRNADRLVLISGGATPVHFAEIKSGARSFSSIGAYGMEEDLAFTGHGTPEILKTNRVSANFLDILGVSPLLGRSFTTPDSTVLISNNLWQRRFQGDVHVVGQTIDLAGTPYTICGVLAPNFAFPSAAIDVWLTDPEDEPGVPRESRALSPVLTVFGRLNPGVTLKQATQEISALQAAYAESYPTMLDAKPKSPPEAKPLHDVVVKSVQLELWLLFGAVGLVLLIACANLASLLLARAAGRSAEFALRSALGARRTQIVTHLLAESLVLAVPGGVVGAFFAFLSVSALRGMNAVDLPRAGEIRFDSGVLAFAIVLSLITGVLFGLAPAISASRIDLITALRASQGASIRLRLRSVLVSSQIALAVVLLIGTTLLIETVLRLRSEPLGFDSQHVLTAHIALSPEINSTRFFENLLQRLSSSPGVEHAAASLTLPMMSYPGTPVQNANEVPLPLNQRPLAAVFIVTPDYFQTLHIPLKRGRTFTDRDREGQQRVAIIDEDLARHFWPNYPAGENPIGQRLLVGGVNKAPAEIVGIVGNAHQDLESLGWNRSVYVAFAQSAPPSAMIAIRVKNNPNGYAPALRRAVEALNPSLPVSEVQPMQNLVDGQLGPRRLLMRVLASFACSALALASIGVYGVVSYSVTQRTREVGIRRTLGAPQGAILRMIINQSLRMALSGVVIGLATAHAATRLLKSYLFHTSATDPVALIGVSGLFITVAIAAALVPALRAARIDPLRALRYE